MKEFNRLIIELLRSNDYSHYDLFEAEPDTGVLAYEFHDHDSFYFIIYFDAASKKAKIVTKTGTTNFNSLDQLIKLKETDNDY